MTNLTKKMVIWDIQRSISISDYVLFGTLDGQL